MSQAVFISVFIDNCSEFLKSDIKKRVDRINYDLISAFSCEDIRYWLSIVQTHA